MKIHLYELTLVLDTPGGVAAPEARSTDAAEIPALPLARDPVDDQPYVPATSLAGSLRAHARATGDDVTLFGELRRETDRTVAVASPVRFLGTRTRLPDGIHHTLRHTSTGIDRIRGAAAPAMIRERELLPPGTTVTAWLRLDCKDGAAPLASRLEELLATWPVRFGGARTTGHGRARLVRLTRRVLDLNTRLGRKIWLTQGGPDLFHEASVILRDESTTAPPPSASLIFGTPLGFQIVDPVHIGSGRRAETGHHATNHNKLVRDHRDHPLIPGTTWKGLLRSRCAFILRSLMESTACITPTGCGDCRVCEAFGYSSTSGALRGRLVFLDSPITHGKGTPARTALRNHVAFDRFTGAAAPHHLYTDEVVENGTVTLTIVDEPSDPAAGPVDPLLLDILLLALYDLHSGAMGVGGGTTRGYGTLRGTGDTTRFLEQQTPAARHRVGQALTALSEEVSSK